MKALRWRTRREAARISLEAALQDSAIRVVKRALALDRPMMVRLACYVIANCRGPALAVDGDAGEGRKVFELAWGPSEDAEDPVRLVGLLGGDQLPCSLCGGLDSVLVYDLVEPVLPTWMGLEIHWCSRGHGVITACLIEHQVREARP